MGRPEKQGLDYFSHDVGSGNDRKLEYIEAIHGLIGYAIYFKLLEKIYENGYFLPWTDRDGIMFAKKNSVDINVYINVINDLINEGLFSRTVFETHNVLTSASIQTRFFASIERRKRVQIIKEYLLFLPDLPVKMVIEYIKPINVDINPINSCGGTQSKVKESKVKKSLRAREENPEDESPDGWNQEKTAALFEEEKPPTHSTESEHPPAPPITPVPKTLHHKREMTKAEMLEMQELAVKIDGYYPYKTYRFNLMLWLQSHTRAHPLAKLKAMQRITEEAERGKPVNNPKGYADAIVDEESKTMNADDSAAECEENKKPTKQGLVALGNIFSMLSHGQA